MTVVGALLVPVFAGSLAAFDPVRKNVIDAAADRRPPRRLHARRIVAAAIGPVRG